MTSKKLKDAAVTVVACTILGGMIGVWLKDKSIPTFRNDERIFFTSTTVRDALRTALANQGMENWDIHQAEFDIALTSGITVGLYLGFAMAVLNILREAFELADAVPPVRYHRH